MAKLTPVMRQYADAKAQHPDAVLFFRLGDFYEMFYEDAVLASGLLGITLTSRNKESPESEPMAGVPHHAAHGHIAKLLAAGHKVAICEQLADPAKTKGIVPRAVVRVVTPGLVTDEDQLDARDNHFLAAVEAQDASFGVALLDLSTGELLAATLSDTTLALGELARAAPREILFGPGTDAIAEAFRVFSPATTARRQEAPVVDADAILARVVGTDAAADAIAHHEPVARAAAARALDLAALCSPRFGVPVRRVGSLEVSATLHLDETAQTHLEIARGLDGSRRGTLLETVDRTLTSGGARLLRRRLLAPLSDVARIRERLEGVERFVTNPGARAELRAALKSVPDLERIAVKVALGQATPRDLGLLRDGLRVFPTLIATLASVRGIPENSARSPILLEDPALFALGDLLARALVDRPASSDKERGFVRPGFDAELDEARKLSEHGAALTGELEAQLRKDTGAAAIRIKYNSVFGWYIEVTRSHLAKVPATWRRKQTVATGERFTTDALDQLAADIESASARETERETSLWADLCEAARKIDTKLREAAAALAELDVQAALAEIAHENDYVRPEVDGSSILDITDGRHPVVERHSAKGRFVPNDTTLDADGGRLYLVTGPNMAGKSTLMRQVALIVILAQAGSYVPAKRARIGVVDRVLSRVGASDNLARGESTFMIEMRETAAILRSATQRSLVILDEIGRGTSTYDGLAIAWAVTEHLHDKIRCRALFATHYHELTVLADTAAHLVNVSVSAREHEGGIAFLHRLTKGPASRSYGIAVARLAGLPKSVLKRATTLLEAFEAEARGTDAPRSERSPSASTASQLALFAAPTAPATPAPVAPSDQFVLEKLRKADLDRMTPIEALTLLAELRDKLDDARGPSAGRRTARTK